MRVHSALFSILTIVATIVVQAQQATAQDRHGLVAFESDSALHRYLRHVMTLRMRARDSAERAQLQHIDSVYGCHITLRERVKLSGPRAVVVARLENQDKGLVAGTVHVGPLGVANADSQGVARLIIAAERLVQPQTVQIHARAVGYHEKTLTVDIAAGDSVEIAARLCPMIVVAMAEVVTSTPEAPPITNVQHEGVDEGGIVKLHGDHLVILRRGRLYTVRIGPGPPRAVAAVNAWGPGIDPDGTWYDEMLISGDRVIVVGYSYERGGTELGIFRIDSGGRLHHESTHQLRSDDYYSSRNYASRLIGTRLVYYAPLYLSDDTLRVANMLPARRTWRHADAGAQPEFAPIATAGTVYRPVDPLDDVDALTLHTVTTCDVAALDLDCRAQVVLGPYGRVFYMSPNAVYVWTTGSAQTGTGESMLYRMPLDGSHPRALRVRGAPVDQFSFLESDDGFLNVVVQPAAVGEAMWSAELWKSGDLALLRVPISAFGDGRSTAPLSAYRKVGRVGERSTQNRFVGNHLIVGAGSGWFDQEARGSTELFVTRWRGGSARVDRLKLSHDVERIEAMGSDAVVIGADTADLHFTAIRLGARPGVAQQYTLSRASQGETRSHGFFYRADGPRTGTLGLPVREAGKPGYEHLFDESSAIVYLRNASGAFTQIGRLSADARNAADDHCVASCMDWYGNSRPLFIRDRVFALLGSELVEARLRDQRLVEVARVNFGRP